MKLLFAYLTLSVGFVAIVGTQVLADNHYYTTTSSTPVNADPYYSSVPARVVIPSVKLGSDADYNLDYRGNNWRDCHVNHNLGLTMDQRIKLRNSRIRLERYFLNKNMLPSQDANLQGHKVEAIRPLLTQYQFHRYLILREQSKKL